MTKYYLTQLTKKLAEIYKIQEDERSNFSFIEKTISALTLAEPVFQPQSKEEKKQD